MGIEMEGKKRAKVLCKSFSHFAARFPVHMKTEEKRGKKIKEFVKCLEISTT
jgi:hypothetical protein